MTSLPWPKALTGLVFAVIAGLMLIVTPVAQAQGDDDGQGLFEQAGPLAVPFGWRTLSQACKELGFDADQLAVAKTLHQGYRSSIKDANAKGRKADKDAHKAMEGENPDWAKYHKERTKIVSQFMKELEAAEKVLMTDLEAVCTPEQKARFASVERARRREQARVFTIAPGEGIDPPALLDSLKVTRTSEIAAAVTQWEESIDRILVERERLIRKLMAREQEMGDDPEKQQKEMKEAFMEFRAIAQRVGDLNRRTAKDLVELLPAEAGAKLEKEARVRTFPRIWGGSQIERAIKVATGRPDITAEQKQKLAELAGAYEAEAEPINTRWAAAADDKFRTLTAEFLESMMGKDQDEKEPFYAIRKERRALDEKYMEKVTELLNQDQRTAVSKEDEKSHGNEFMPEFLPDIGKDFEARVEEWKSEEEP